MADPILVTANFALPADELEFAVSRSSGPGGQSVNTTDSRVEVRFDVAGSPSLTEPQRARLIEVLGGRLDSEGRLRVVAQTHRSQLLNRRAAVERLRTLLADALRPPTPRRPTKPSAAARRQRLETKRRRAVLKRRRRPPVADDG
jgi:ribosome-associated protein